MSISLIRNLMTTINFPLFKREPKSNVIKWISKETYQKIRNGRKDDGFVSPKTGIGHETTDKGKDGGDAVPQIYVFCSRSKRLFQNKR